LAMKAASTALMELLRSNQQFIMADLYTITLVGGWCCGIRPQRPR
jgi:hypothetical protein